MVCLTGAAALVDLFKGLLTKDDPNNLNITVDSAKSGHLVCVSVHRINLKNYSRQKAEN